MYQELNCNQFKQKLNADPEAVIIDVRSQEEWDAGYIEGAIRIEYNNGDFSKAIYHLDPSKSYFIYCRSGLRSRKACVELDDAGFQKVYNLMSGYLAWGNATAKS
jgi:rhodanese-related sulfurtransferase